MSPKASPTEAPRPATRRPGGPGPAEEPTRTVSPPGDLRALGPRAVLHLQRTGGNQAVLRWLAPRPPSGPPVQRVLDTKALGKYQTALKAKTGLPIGGLVNLIKTKLQAGGHAVTVEHVTQILGALGVGVPKELKTLVSGGGGVSLQDFQNRFQSAEGGPIDGIANARGKVTPEMSAELPDFINALTTTNMFDQHDGSSVRYDKQNAGKTTTNLQIQLGGKDVYVPKKSAQDKSSVTCVVVDDTIIEACLKSPQIATWVLGQVVNAHVLSRQNGVNVHLTLS